MYALAMFSPKGGEILTIPFLVGDVVLRDLKLKAEALNSLKLPVTVKAGFVGTITLKVFVSEICPAGLLIIRWTFVSNDIQSKYLDKHIYCLNFSRASS